MPSSADGFVQDLERLKGDLARDLVALRKRLQAQAGAPWGSEKITRAEALARMDEFDDPARAEELAHLSDGALAQAALQAAQMRLEAWKAGEWAPGRGREAIGQPEGPVTMPALQPGAQEVIHSSPGLMKMIDAMNTQGAPPTGDLPPYGPASPPGPTPAPPLV